jgi:hypothetical protein
MPKEAVMLSYTDLGMALLVIAALVTAIAFLNKHPEAGRRRLSTQPPLPIPRGHVRMGDDPSLNLGRRRDDGAGGEG